MSKGREKTGKRAGKPAPRRAREQMRRVLNLVQTKTNGLILINPDPDSMASAMAMKRLLWKRLHKITIGYIGEIQRLDNQAMMELLKIPMVQFREELREGFDCRILVDSQPNHSPVFESFTYDIIIDHHPKAKTWPAPFVDIRPEYGATSTMLAEYLRAADIKPSMRLATALLYGIKTDTANFERSGIEQDVRQFQYVFKHANMNLLRKIESSDLRLEDLDVFHQALGNRHISRKGIYAHLGRVPNPDICVQIADFFTRVHGIGWVFVSGAMEDRVVVILRNDGFRKDAGRLAKRAFGSLGSAGGHEGAARAEIPLEALKKEGVKGHGAGVANFIRHRLGI